MAGSSGFLDSESVPVSKSEQVARKSELIPGTQASSSTLRGLSWYEMIHLDAQESKETPRGMSWMDRSPD
jgi:hypothetical protein